MRSADPDLLLYDIQKCAVYTRVHHNSAAPVEGKPYWELTSMKANHVHVEVVDDVMI